jgi:hypothetical protein
VNGWSKWSDANTPAIERAEDSAILDWLEAHGISVRIQQNEQQSFVIPATRDAIRFEMTAGNVEENTDEA